MFEYISHDMLYGVFPKAFFGNGPSLYDVNHLQYIEHVN